MPTREILRASQDYRFSLGAGTRRDERRGPAPGGYTLVAAVDVVGADVVELAPPGGGVPDVTALAAERVVREALGGMALARGGSTAAGAAR
jgi:hypothetical protein